MRALALVPALLSLVILTALPAQAHVHTCITGSTASSLSGDDAACPSAADFDIVVGWLHEPATTGQMNGLDLGIHDLKKDTWVENVTSVTAQYEYGGKTLKLSLAPQDDKPGWYTDSVIPTREGQFTVRVGGTVQGHAASFVAKPEAVDPATDHEFPTKDPSTHDLDARLTALEEKVQTLQPVQGGVSVTPQPPGAKGTPGFEPVALVAGLTAALGLARRR